MTSRDPFTPDLKALEFDVPSNLNHLMTTSDLTDKKRGMHVHFESVGPDGREIEENSDIRVE